MNLEAFLHPGGSRKTLELPDGASGLDLLQTLGLAPDVHILVRSETPIPEDEPLAEGDHVRVIAVVSGG